MSSRSSFNGLLMLAMLAFVGFLLVYIPPQVIDQYRSVAQLGRPWVILYFTVVGTGAVLLLSSTCWTLWRLWRHTRQKRQRRTKHAQSPSQLSRDEQQAEIDENLTAVRNLRADERIQPEVREQLEPLVARVEAKRAAEQLEIVAFGTVSSGKSSLLNALAGQDVFLTDAKGGTTVRRAETPWPGIDRVTLVDTPGLGEVEGAERTQLSAESARDADLVLFAVDGPLRESEMALLTRLAEMEKRILVCLNKADWYDASQRERLIGQIREQVQSYVAADNVVAVQTQGASRTRVRILANGSEVSEYVEETADIHELAERMLRVVRGEGPSLLVANLLLQSRGLIEDARKRVADSLDERARETVNRYMWRAGGIAALSPFPLVDMVAGCAVSSKMVVDLARVYRQDIDFDAAVKLMGQLGKNLLGILGASAATPAVATAVASLLKTVPGVGTIAGGLLQGTTQALLTRWIGSVFIVYFRNEMQHPEGGLTGLARREWEHVTSMAELRKLVQQARQMLRSDQS